jgi:molecular chaperone GrpE
MSTQSSKDPAQSTDDTMTQDQELQETMEVVEEIQEINWQEESEKNLNGWKRAQADYQNLKKQTELEKFEIRKYASAHIIEEMVPVFDNFALAIKHCPQELADNSWVQGVLYIKQQWTQVLLEQGVEIVEPSVGEPFDPNTQEAIDTQPDGDGLVSEVVQHGYRLHDRMIRPARVRLS